MNVRGTYFTARGLQALTTTERETWSSFSHPLRRRLWLWRRGFLSRSGVLYDLEESTYREYVTDYQRFVRTKRINGPWSVTLSNKLVFHWLMQPFEKHRMAVYGMVRGGAFHPVDTLEPSRGATTVAPASSPPLAFDRRDERDASTPSSTQNAPETWGATGTRDAAEWVVDRLETEAKLVLKWVRGGGGNNVLLCSRVEDGYRVNGDHYAEPEFRSLVRDLEEYLVCEFVEQGPFPAGLYPETPNTIRIVTMYDEEAGEAFVPVAIQRIGTADSAPMDNFSQGGLSAEIDLETGELGPGVSVPQSGSLEWHTQHPDTGAQVEGARVPAWTEIERRVLELADAYPFVPYVGWDVVLTGEDGEFLIIEANSYPGLKSIQVHGPLLTDDRVRRFYERHGVL